MCVHLWFVWEQCVTKMNKAKAELYVCTSVICLWTVCDQDEQGKSWTICVYICDLFGNSVWPRWTRERLSCICVYVCDLFGNSVWPRWTRQRLSYICVYVCDLFGNSVWPRQRLNYICVYVCDLFVNSVWPRWTRQRTMSWTPMVWQRLSCDRWQVSTLPGLLACKHHLRLFFETSHGKDFFRLCVCVCMRVLLML